MIEYWISIGVFIFLNCVMVLVIHKDWYYKKRHYERIIFLYDEFIEMLEEHSGDLIIETEIKALRKKLNR